MGIDTKYRPKIFDDVIGQDVVTTILRSIVIKKKYNSAYLFEGPSGVGKAQPLWSNVLTPDGFKEMRAIKLSDRVIGKNGKIYNVKNIFDHKNRDYYKIIFSDNTWAHCDEDHLWLVHQYKKNNYKLKDDVLSLNEIKKRINLGYKIGIPLNDAINFGRKIKLWINPYLLGALLGDGSFKSSCIEFTNTEKDIINKLINLLPKDCELILKDKITYSIRKKYHKFQSNFLKINNKTSICNFIQLYKLFGKSSWEKFIPEAYLYSSINDRLELLQGLFDTDGHVHNKTTIEYSTTSEILASQVVFIVRSLGGKATIYNRMGSYKKNNIVKKTRINYRVYVSMPDNLCPVSSERKLKNYGNGHRQKNNKFIKNIIFEGKTDTRCLLIDSPDHLYITDGFNVTHNTTIARIFAKAILCASPVNGNPCGVCESCKLFDDEKNYGYTELDAASVGGKDDMVQLKNDAAFISVEKKKIICLDECHDISNQGQDALLKQVEQCPDHLIYLFCTTESNKIKPTLRKRCTPFQFSRVSPDLIFTRLKQIGTTEGITSEDEALRIIADRSDGHVRDALKLLEEASNFGPVTIDSVSKISVDYSSSICEVLANLGSNLPHALEVSKNISTYIPVWDFYEQMLSMISDAVKIIYGYEDFLPKRKEYLIKLRDVHGCNLIEFMNYLMSREKFVDRIGLNSDIILLHYKFCTGGFKPQIPEQKIVQETATAVQKPKEEQATPSTSPTVKHAQLMSLPVSERVKLLRQQHGQTTKSSEKEDTQKVPFEWSLPKEERQGSDSSGVGQKELSPLEFSRLLVGGRGGGSI